MKQPKKIFTRMLINNWGGISHKMLEFHEYVNLFSGKSGSGKSTVMDAIQVVLYGSVSANFLNKAADDSKNKRSVLSYLRGAQKDGTANRGDVDFCSQIVLEIEDTATHIVTCVGAAFEVAKGDTDLKKYTYFSHSGRIPKDEYLENNVPYSIAQIRKLTEERSRSADNRGRGEVNKVYPSKEAYLYTLYGEIFGQVEQGRMITMEKSAIALKMTSGTGQFIRDYMFPKTKEDTVATISEQLGAYREIKERVEDLEKRIEMLDKIQVYDRELTNVRAEKVRTETVLKCIDIEENIIRLKGRESELESVEKEADEAKKEQKILQDELQTIRDERARVQAELNNSDYGKKEQELKDLEYRIALLADNSAQWRQIVKGLKRWEEEDVVTDYVSNRALQLIQEIRGGALTEKLCKELRTHLDLALDNITNELSELRISIHETEKDIKEKQDAVEDLQNDRKPYPLELKKARQELQRALSDRYGRKIEVHIFADLFDITDEKWKNAIEGRLGRIKKSMITEPAYALDAAKIFRRMQQFEEVDLINSEAVQKDSPEADENSLYEAVHAESGYVDRCLKRYLGRIQKCETVEELSTVKDGVTPDCYSYSGYMFRHSGFDGQMSLMEDEFFRKYERKIGLLTEKFMPSREEDGAGREKHKNEMERFADYRNYLDFNMYEQSIDENGIEKKNYVDDMAGVDSGGEGQNPKYVALLAGFAMLYMQQSNRDSKIRLVLLDEAFSKMDKERSEVCLKYARELELQLIVCVPDERLQSLIRNVDSVYGFRRFRNQVTMMHIDKGNYLDMIAGESRSEEV